MKSQEVDSVRTELVNRILSVFDAELQNTPDYSRRRSAEFTQIAEILSDFERNLDRGLKDNRLKIEVWEARHFGVPDGALFMQLWNHGLVGLGKHNGCVYFLENESNL
jgi:hypothetical protein